MSQELLSTPNPQGSPSELLDHTNDGKLRGCHLQLIGSTNSSTSFNKINMKARNWISVLVPVKKTTSRAVTPCGSMISNQECWDGGSAREGLTQGIGKLFCSHSLTKNHSRPNPVQVLCSMDGQATQTQTDSNLPAHFPHKLLLKKVLRSTLRKIRQNLKMNAMLEIAYITNLFLIGTINKNTY